MSDSPKAYHTLVEVYLASGSAYFWSDGDVDAVWNGRTYSASGPEIERDTITRKLGIEVGESTITFRAGPEIELESMPFVQAARLGLFDSARIILRDAVFALGETTPRVVVHLFEGQTGELDVGRYSVQTQILSYLVQLNVQIPRGAFQPQCLWTLYDQGCRVDRSKWMVQGAAQGGSARLAVVMDRALVDGQYAGGTLTGISGANIGVSRTIRANAGSTVSLMIALPADVVPGDRFTLLPTCNRTIARCKSFGNIARYRGTPFVPQPEASV
ncbi:DUF2163 domain-containing protein [Paraburkholderia sp. J11-2]|uniref:DUF2163 domain-containing protein n=1 Tax=Paraburkholderia sp. J11-2 TaxID=2805431 RepID=UPI002AB695AA|nr:DUF2163 domain-containing protein [Paraburkholderia sp. J11-2]